MNLKVGDTVKVIAGDDKGSSGKVLKVIRSKNRVIVEGIAMVKKHNKPNSNNPKGGITEKESSIHISMLFPLLIMTAAFALFSLLIFLMKYNTELIKIKNKGLDRL